MPLRHHSVCGMTELGHGAGQRWSWDGEGPTELGLGLSPEMKEDTCRSTHAQFPSHPLVCPQLQPREMCEDRALLRVQVCRGLWRGLV